jgi:hypothetical protein
MSWRARSAQVWSKLAPPCISRDLGSLPLRASTNVSHRPVRSCYPLFRDEHHRSNRCSGVEYSHAKRWRGPCRQFKRSKMCFVSRSMSWRLKMRSLLLTVQGNDALSNSHIDHEGCRSRALESEWHKYPVPRSQSFSLSRPSFDASARTWTLE